MIYYACYKTNMPGSCDASTAGERGLRAARGAVVAVFAYRDAKGRPAAWPVTPYVHGGSVVVTSTLAFIRKAIHVRADGRVALLAAGTHMNGKATVSASSSGDAFIERILPQEIEKYPPTREIVSAPCSRALFWWYYGRVFITFRPVDTILRPGSDAATLLWIDDRGFPSILPIEAPDRRETSFALRSLLEPLPALGRPVSASILLHAQPTPRDLRQLLLRGDLDVDGRFHVRSSVGSLENRAATSGVGEVIRQLSYHRAALRARRTIRDWPAPENGGLA